MSNEMGEIEEWLDSNQTEHPEVTNRFVVDQMYRLLKDFYDKNNLAVDNKTKLYEDFCLFVYDKTGY